MNNEMANYPAKKLAEHMETIADMYTMAIFYNKLIPEHPWGCGRLVVVPYKLDGTHYKSMAIFHAEDLIAIVAENDVMYEFVNMYDEGDELKAEILSDLNTFIITGYGPRVIHRYPKIDE